VLASRIARRTAPLDGVTAAVNDAGLVGSDARHARDLDFWRQTLHTSQSDRPCQAEFPTDNGEIEWAQDVLAAGGGAPAVRGEMIDEPVKVRARAILARMS
jgi:citrate lyase subunit beta/citryl-CoA lyase